MRRLRVPVAGLAAALLVSALLGAVAGCAPVRPWERDVLARPDMAFDADDLEARRRSHVFFSKEGSLQGGGAGGGGCGCN
jgi:hypothetical protein